MSDSEPEKRKAVLPVQKPRWIPYGILGGVCVLVIAVYACATKSGPFESLTPKASDAYYNLLVQGFRAGQLNVKKDVPPGLAQLADPYDPVASAPYQGPPYQLIDLSYYKGKLYLYWGITPVLLLFWPFATLTGHYLFHREAVIIFCTIGFLASTGLLCALRRRYFDEVDNWVVAACVLALGLATGVPTMLPWSDIYEVSISCGYMLTMLTLVAIWRALSEPQRQCQWLAVASATYGLAVAARPDLIFGAVALLVPVIVARRERRPMGTLVIAAIGPIMVIGLGMLLYNVLRFDSPLEFGIHYQLAGARESTQRFFDLRYVWFNFRVYFLQVMHWNRHFPFVGEVSVPVQPPGYMRVENAFGILTSTPLVWLALAVPLSWRNQPGEKAMPLRWFVTTVFLVFGMCALTLTFFSSAIFRYEVDFLPSLILLAVIGILGLERALANRPGLRRTMRWGWGLLLAYSVAFNLLFGVQIYAKSQYYIGTSLWRMGRAAESIDHFEQALRSKPDYAEVHSNLGLALQQQGKLEEAIGHYKEALRLRPDKALAHYNLAGALAQAGQTQEAIAQWEQALQIKPDFAEAHYNLGVALEQMGRVPEAIAHYEEALRINPDFIQAQNSLNHARASH